MYFLDSRAQLFIPILFIIYFLSSRFRSVISYSFNCVLFVCSNVHTYAVLDVVYRRVLLASSTRV